MIQSILDSTKRSLGLDSEYDVFDPDLVMHINSALFTLNQVGIGPPEGFQISGSEEVWTSFTDNDPLLNAAKSYVYVSVRLLFDPPQTSYLVTAFERQQEEYLSRLSIHREGTAWSDPASTTS